MAKKKNVQKKNGGNVWFNVIIAVIIVAVLALAVWAVAPKYIGTNNTDQQTEEQPVENVAAIAEQLGLSIEDFMAKYEITGDGVTGETMMVEVVNKMRLETYINLLNDVYGDTYSFQDFINENGIPADRLTADTTVEEAQNLIPISFYLNSVELDTDFETLKSEAGLGADVTLDTPWAEVSEKLIPVVEKHIVEPEPTEEIPNSAGTVEVVDENGEKRQVPVVIGE